MLLGLFGELSTNGSNSFVVNNGECGFTFRATSLSKQEFIDAITNFANSKAIDNDFVTNAGYIYDKGVSMNINPELVIIRGYGESHLTNPPKPYNYWGLGCYNEGGADPCITYESFNAGVDAFLDNLSQYDSLVSWMSKYAYLGDVWYNPGGSGLGGCYYKDLIYGDDLPSNVKAACGENAPSCKKKDDPGCVATSQNDRDAYTKYQINNYMAGIRKNIFGLEANEGVSCYNGTLPNISGYPLDHEGLKVLHTALPTSDADQISGYIKSSVASAGYGTGSGVAAAAQSIIYAVAQKGYYLPYYWGGGHGGKVAIVGYSPILGSPATKSCSDTNCYYFHSFDCSGFVSWAIKNGCKSNFSAFDTRGFNSNKFGSVISINETKPGDIMVKNGHIRLVIRNNGDGSVLTAESTGDNGNKDNGGLIFSNYTANNSYVFRDMSGWYSKNCDNNG